MKDIILIVSGGRMSFPHLGNFKDRFVVGVEVRENIPTPYALPKAEPKKPYFRRGRWE